ncbi:amidophosphoribosyltransferase [Fusibacillus kribbianus]|uniref:Amidophosphoribosyltransferase n=1 Tax=Fusibacillus kribbianus TaxID=3044208 RepID=A0AAP4B9T3_9FIRM|nr:amidophosphoribosyltransferase [Ruminococcus sp. YH-rum2234]MDI9241507.1 amidophosphoribosyltransferase [Ruminococcus sp. YH-rum2234]
MNKQPYETFEDFDRIHEECGVFGVYDFDRHDVAPTIYYGLLALQHRGQESCGIAVSDTEGPKGKVLVHKGMGLTNEVFTPEHLERLSPGDIGVGHVRYSTAGASTRENAQPLVLNYIKGTLALAHNGNLVNAPELRRELEYDGAIFQTTIDTEVIAYHIARARVKSKTVEEAVGRAMRKLVGAYSLVIMSPRKLIGARDPFGFKPLCIGKRDNAYILSSESCALDTVGAEFVRDVRPGEIVSITRDGIKSDTSLCLPPEKEARCIFEYIYFARPDTRIDGVSVYHARLAAGRFLAKDHPVEADLVVGVPESGNAAAQGYAQESGIPYGTAFVKNSYVGRTFIKPKQKSRESSVQVKLNVLKESVAGKRIIMVDDSIVRGTTCGRIVNMLREAGAKEVHVRISAPPFLHPCYFGTDIPSEDQLIAHGRTVEEIRQEIGADSLGYLGLDRLPQMAEGLPICTACFSGEYPIEPPREDIRGEYQK